MKRTKRRLPIPQWEFGFTLATFNLMFETALDGDRITREFNRASPQDPTEIALPAETAPPMLFGK